MKFRATLPLQSALRAAYLSRRVFRRPAVRPGSLSAIVLIGLLWTLSASTTSNSQTPAQPASQPAPPPPASTPQSHETPPAAAPLATETGKSQSGEITEDELKQLLVGKQLFLRGGYLGESLSFSEHGLPVGHPAVGSFALSGVEIERVRLTRHKVQLEGARYALHFLGALPYEDPSKAVDRIKITPKKKVLRISIDREQIFKEKKSKDEKKSSKAAKPSRAGASPAELAKEDVASSETDVAQPAAVPQAKPATEAAPQTPPPSESASAPSSAQASAQASEDAADKPADQASVTSTTSPIHAARMLREALDRIFAPGLDDKVKAQMPAFWQLYYQAQAAGVDYRPRDPGILRSSGVDQQAKVLTFIAPASNEFAQASGISGQALYRVVIGTDGKPGEVAVERPIGFGLDENAVAAIRKATFQPALKAGQPVAETLDLAVLFRIYSKRTSVAGAPDPKPADPLKPGPYTVNAPQAKPQ